jgi:hypothetical protein
MSNLNEHDFPSTPLPSGPFPDTGKKIPDEKHPAPVFDPPETNPKPKAPAKKDEHYGV